MAKKTGQVNLYGEISSWSEENSAIAFIRRLKEAAVGSEAVEINIHCIGGEVFDGNMICNAIASLGVPVDARVEGVCASMAAIILTYCRNVAMAKNAHILIHSPSSYICGDASAHEKAAKLLRSLETNAIADFAKRTGKSKKEVQKWFEGDNWFNAQEAQELKIVDVIFETKEAPEEIIPAQDLKNMDYPTLYNTYKAVVKNNEPINKISNQNESEMDKQSLINRFGLTGVTAQSSDTDIETAIETKMKAGREELATMKKQQITDVITAAVADKKITEAQKPTYQTIGETSGIDALKAVFAGMKTPEPQQTITDAIKKVTQTGTPIERSDWDWDKWQKDDPRGLEKLQGEDADAFKALYDKKYKSN